MGYRVYFNYEDDLGNIETLYESFEDYDDAVRFAERAEQVTCYSEVEIEDLENDTIEFLLY